MKQCPQCRQTYSDDTIFCLSDGTPLVLFNDTPEEVTVFKPIQPTQEEITVVRPAQNIQPPTSPTTQGVSPIFAYLTVGLLLLLIGGGVILAGIFVISQMSGGNTNNEIAKVTNKADKGQNKIDEEQANLRQQQDQLEKERQRVANERKKLDEEKNKPIFTPTPISPPSPPTPPPSYPPQPTARIKFGRGRVAESISGKVYTQRNFVLEAKSGQYLSASVSGGGCVTFSNGGTSIGFSTIKGDNRLTLVNNCDREASFSMTVSIR